MQVKEHHIGQLVHCATQGLNGKIISIDHPHKTHRVLVSFPAEGVFISYTRGGRLNTEQVLKEVKS